MTPRKQAPPALKRHQANATQAATIRRAAIAEQMTKGVTVARDLAVYFGVSERTIYNDFTVVQQQFCDRAVEVHAERRGLQLERIDAAISALWPKVQKGNTTAVAQLVALMQREARLLGLDAPTNISLNWSDALTKAGVDSRVLYEQIVVLIMGQIRGTDAQATLEDDDLDVSRPISLQLIEPRSR